MRVYINRTVNVVSETFEFEGSTEEFVGSFMDGALSLFLNTELSSESDSDPVETMREDFEHYNAGYEAGYSDAYGDDMDYGSEYCEGCKDCHDTIDTQGDPEAPYHECVHDDGVGVSCNCVRVEDCQMLDEQE
jgi:hypothetical protein